MGIDFAIQMTDNERSRAGATNTHPASDTRPTRDRQSAVADCKPIPSPTTQDENRFWSKVAVPEQPSCCWEWEAVKTNGYGQFWLSGNQFQAHRVSYSWLIGSIPAEMCVDHLCRNRSCVNPDHLRLVSNAVNVLAGFGHGAINRNKTHCPRGHEYTPENTRVSAEGHRFCRTCSRLHDRRYRNRKVLENANLNPRGAENYQVTIAGQLWTIRGTDGPHVTIEIRCHDEQVLLVTMTPDDAADIGGLALIAARDARRVELAVQS